MKAKAKSITKKAIVALLTLVLVLGAMPVTVMANTMNIYGTGNFNVPTGYTATVTGDVYDSTITVNGGTLILAANHTITGNVTVQNGGRFYMSNGRITGAGTRGVTVTGGYSRFNMSGGVIAGNSTTPVNTIAQNGGGVLVNYDAVFNMSSGRIENNSGNRGGGVAVMSGASFTMSYNPIYTPPVIANNRTRPYATALDGGGVLVNGANTSFCMERGIIEGNESYRGSAGGVDVVQGATFTMSGNSIIRNNRAGNNGGGVRVQHAGSSFIMYNGEIYGNLSSHTVYYASPTAVMQGGGVNVVSGGSMTMHGGVIRNNQAVGGGGVRVAASSSFDMRGGVIRDNIALENGGGSLVDATSTMIATGGHITNNTATNYGGGIWAANYESLTIYPSVTFVGNRANRPYDHGFDNDEYYVPSGQDDPMGTPERGQGGDISGIHLANEWATGSIRGAHLLNNFDINFVGVPTRLPIIPREGDIGIIKYLRMPANTTSPDVSFIFDVVLDEVRRPGGAPITLIPEQIAAITVPSPTVAFASTTGTTRPSSGTDLFARQEVGINFNGINWPYPGVYRFIVTERQDTNTIANGTIVYDNARFYVYVYVGWACGGVYFQDLMRVGYDIRRYGTPVTPGVKPDIEFENRYLPNSTLEISKLVTGMGDMSGQFPFTLELSWPAGAVRPAYNQVTVTRTRLNRHPVYSYLTGGTTDSTITFTIGADGIARPPASPALYFMHGDIFTIANLPVGTTFTLVEPAVVNYDQTAVVTGGGQTFEFEQESDEDYALIVYGTVVGGGTVVVVTNYLYEPTPMGVFLSNMPFGLMVALGAGALVATGAVAVAHGKAKRKR